jgi:anti-sigma factor RsiW
MECSKVRVLLEEWLDGELSGEQRAGVERHLRECAECALTLEERRRLGTAVKATLSKRTAGLRFQPPPLSRLAAPGRAPWLHFNPRGLLAVAAMALVVLLFVFRPWTRLRRKTAVEKLPIAVITVSDSLNGVDESFISGRVDGFTYLIHLQVSMAKTNDHS